MTDPDALATLTRLPANGQAERGIAILPERDRVLLLARRQCLLIELGAIETYLGLERSVIPRHKRDECEEMRR